MPSIYQIRRELSVPPDVSTEESSKKDMRMTTHGLTDDRLTTMNLLSEAYHGLNSLVTELLDRHQLSAIEFDVLRHLAREPDARLRMSDVAALTRFSQSGMTRVVDRLQQRGLVKRQACGDDRRSWYTVLTDAGLGRLRAALPDYLDLIQRFVVDQTSRDQLRATVATLHAIRSATVA
jgi:MarR family transcriptional regulator, 2-MHQ and catechol-resistance regulon repressor